VKWIVSPVKTPKLDLIGCFFFVTIVKMANWFENNSHEL